MQITTIAMALLAASLNVAAGLVTPTCATIDLDLLLKESRPAKDAQSTLIKEFSNRYAEFDQLKLAASKAQTAFLEAKQKQTDSEELQQLERVYRSQLESLSLARSPLDKEFNTRKSELLDSVLRKISDTYQRVGRELKFALLFQDGQHQPAFVLEPGSNGNQCATKAQITSTLMEALEKID